MARDLSSDLRRAGLLAAVIGLAVGGLAVVYPWVLDTVLSRIGIRGLAVVLLAVLSLSIPLRIRMLGGHGPVVWLPVAGLGALFTIAAVSNDATALRVIPAFVYACIAGVFAASLRAPDSIIERGARWIVPEAPIFIRSYCRKTTCLWIGIFLSIAAVTTSLAIAGDTGAWRTFTSRTVWWVMAAVSSVEFLFRKAWFRYYARGGPFERFWSTLFPAERTERGHRSSEYIRQMTERQRLANDSVADEPTASFFNDTGS